MAAKGNIGSVENDDVKRVNALRDAHGFANAGEAVALLLEEYESVHGTILDEDGTVKLDEVEVGGVTEARRLNARYQSEMERLFVREKEMHAEALEAEAKKAEELTAQLTARDETIAERDKTIAEQVAELEDLRKKAASVEALAEQLKVQTDEAAKAREAQAEQAARQAEQMGKLIERIDAEAERHATAEATLTAERDAAQAKLATVEQERDALADEAKALQAQVDQLKAEMAEVKKAKE